jgi:membrane associated rhomboid family serine protease
LKTTLNYKPALSIFRYGTLPFGLALCAILGQIVAPLFYQQGLDLTESFFLYVLLAQLTHLGWAHLALNLLGLSIIIWGFSSWNSPKQQALSLLVAWVWVAFYLTYIEHLVWYCGFSGALHASFTSQWVWAWRERRPKQTPALILLGIGLGLKLVLEAFSDGTLNNTIIGGPIAFEAHRGGALGGLLLGLLLSPFRTRQQNRHPQHPE